MKKALFKNEKFKAQFFIITTIIIYFFVPC